MDPRYPLKAYLPIENASIKGIDAILRRAARELEREIRNSAGAEGVGAVVKQNQMVAQLAAIRAHLDQDWTKIASAINRGQAAALAESVRVVGELEWPMFKGLVDRADFESIIDLEAGRAARSVRTVMDRLTGSYIPLSEQVYKTSQIADGWVDNAVNSALAHGLTTDEFAKEVRKFISPDTPGGVSYAARRLARTEINNAYHIGTQRRYAEHGIVEFVDWNLSSSHPEGDECDDYKANSPFRLDETPDKPHPQCLCFLTPSLPSSEEFLAALFARPESSSSPDRAYAGVRASILQRLAERLKMSYSEYQDYVLSTSLRPNAGSVMPSLLNSDFARNVFMLNAQRAARTRAISAPAPALSYTTRHWWRRDNGGTTLVAWRKPTRTTGAPRTMPPSQSSLIALRKPALEELSAARVAVEPVRNQPSYVAATTSLQRQNQLKGLKYISFEELPQDFKQDLMKLPVWDYMERNAALATVTGGEFHEAVEKQMRQVVSDLVTPAGWKVGSGSSKILTNVSGNTLEFAIDLTKDSASQRMLITTQGERVAMTFTGAGVTAVELVDLVAPLASTFPKTSAVSVGNMSGLELRDAVRAGWIVDEAVMMMDQVVDNISEMLEDSDFYRLTDADVKFLKSLAEKQGMGLSPRDIANYTALSERNQKLLWATSKYNVSKEIAPAPGATPKVIPPVAGSPGAIKVVDKPDFPSELQMIRNANAHTVNTLPNGFESVSGNERFALSVYRGSGHTEINSASRTIAAGSSVPSNKEIFAQHAKAINDLLYKNQTTSAGVVFRQEGAGGFLSKDEIEMVKAGSSVVGREVTYNNFVSTSYTDEFGNSFIGFKVPIALRIHLPEGTFGSLINNAKEREFLLAAGSRFKVIGQSVNPTTQEINLDVMLVGQDKSF